MDNLRNLSNSLPARRHDAQTAELLSSFKAAALSVTTLYKTAAADQTRARSAGYQDALDDLLAFLDKEKLGFMDGEGWRVRGWATERLDDGARRRQTDRASEDEAEIEDTGDMTRSSSPDLMRKPVLPISSSILTDESTPRHSSEPPRPQLPNNEQHAANAPRTSDFSFRAPHSLPTNHDREAGMELDNTSVTSAGTSATESSAPVRIIPRTRRDRHGREHRRRGGENQQQQPPTLNFNLGTGAGSKRKLPYADLFDISGVNFDGNNDWRKDGTGGSGGNARMGKRGRHA